MIKQLISWNWKIPSDGLLVTNPFSHLGGREEGKRVAEIDERDRSEEKRDRSATRSAEQSVRWNEMRP